MAQKYNRNEKEKMKGSEREIGKKEKVQKEGERRV